MLLGDMKSSEELDHGGWKPAEDPAGLETWLTAGRDFALTLPAKKDPQPPSSDKRVEVVLCPLPLLNLSKGTLNSTF